jgi:hypothetical protein
VVVGKVTMVTIQAQEEDKEVLHSLVAMVLVVVLMEQVLLVQPIQVVAVAALVLLELLLVRLVEAQAHIVKNLSIHHLPHMLTLLEQVEVAVRQEQADLLVVLVVQV